jgi:hypothetical protein
MKVRFLVPGIAALALVVGAAAPASAAVPPPAASCSAVTTGVVVPPDPAGLVATASVIELSATVTCQPAGLLNTAPADDIPPYKGQISFSLTVNGVAVGCAVGVPEGSLWPSVGPTLVMHLDGTCVVPVNGPRGAAAASVDWATMTLSDTSYTVASQAIPLVVL